MFEVIQKSTYRTIEHIVVIAGNHMPSIFYIDKRGMGINSNS